MKQSQGNRGVAFEMLINYSNTMYKSKGLAIISKRPTPITIIRESKVPGHFIARFDKKSTVDYTGVYRGHAIEFEAKSTRQDTRWPLDDIQKHQVEHLKRVHEHGGIAFVLVEFATKRTVYLLTYEHLMKAWNESLQGSRKSIPYSDFEHYGIKLGQGRSIPLDYLAAVDRLIELGVSA